MKKYLLHSILLFTFTINLHADLSDPGTGTPANFTHINSDFGPRNVTEGTNPHLAIDYRIKDGSHGHAVQDGVIPKENGIDLIGTEYTYIQVGPWRYMHMEDDKNADSTFQLYPAGTINDTRGDLINAPIIVFREISGSGLNTIKAISTSEERKEFRDPGNSAQTVGTQNSISQSDDFCAEYRSERKPSASGQRLSYSDKSFS